MRPGPPAGRSILERCKTTKSRFPSDDLLPQGGADQFHAEHGGHVAIVEDGIDLDEIEGPGEVPSPRAFPSPCGPRGSRGRPWPVCPHMARSSDRRHPDRTTRDRRQAPQWLSSTNVKREGSEDPSHVTVMNPSTESDQVQSGCWRGSNRGRATNIIYSSGDPRPEFRGLSFPSVLLQLSRLVGSIRRADPTCRAACARASAWTR